jgi:hypothetical protein
VLQLDGERRDSRFILIWALDHDRVITLRPVGVSPCVGLIVLCCLSLQGAYGLSLYRRGGYGMVTILVGSKEGVLN